MYRYLAPLAAVSLGAWILLQLWGVFMSLRQEPQDCAKEDWHGKAPVVGLTPQTESQCHDLNELESAADKSTEVSSEAMRAFEDALRQWGQSHAGVQPDCRTRALGIKLCALSQGIVEFRDTLHARKARGESDFWDEQMLELSGHESRSEDCRDFHSYVKSGWKPAVFTWLNCDFHRKHIEELLDDPLYTSVWKQAAHQTAPYGRWYGPPEVTNIQTIQGVQYQKKRVQNLNHLRLMTAVMPGFQIANVAQWIEFGAGSADLAAGLHALGFPGVHFLLDLPPMNLMQWYWLRYSSIPAYLGTSQFFSSRPNPRSMAGKIILESSAEDTRLFKHLNQSDFSKSVFFATYSYTEADFDTRDRFRQLLRKCGIIYMVFWSDFKGKNNDVYLNNILEEVLLETHNVQIWKHEKVGFYFVARKKELGPVLCLPEWNCHWYTMHHSIPHGGFKAFILIRILFAVSLLTVLACLYLAKRKRGREKREEHVI